MSMTTYAVYATSPSLNQKIRRFDLAMINVEQQDATLAQRDADSFANLLCQQQHMHATDWYGSCELEQHGIETLEGYISHNG